MCAHMQIFKALSQSLPQFEFTWRGRPRLAFFYPSAVKGWWGIVVTLPGAQVRHLRLRMRQLENEAS